MSRWNLWSSNILELFITMVILINNDLIEWNDNKISNYNKFHNGIEIETQTK